VYFSADVNGDYSLNTVSLVKVDAKNEGSLMSSPILRILKNGWQSWSATKIMKPGETEQKSRVQKSMHWVEPERNSNSGDITSDHIQF